VDSNPAGSMSLGLIVCCQIKFTVSGSSFVQGSPIECLFLTASDSETSIMRRSWPTESCYAMEKEVRLGSSGRNLWLGST
jgi:hypothetical protein